MKSAKTFPFVVAGVAGWCVIGSWATAGEDAPTDARLDEIIVTAERVQEREQKTAISMSVYNADIVESEGVHDIQSLTRIDPSINFTTQTGAAYVAMRGIASTDLTELGDPAVAVSRDGFFTNRPFGLFSSMYDVERIEVLKGPQGTLYGRNSVGGEINIISQRPTRDLGGYVNLDIGNYYATNAEGAVNFPLGDVVQFRLSGIARRHDGYRINPGYQNGDDEDNKSGRAQLSFQPWGGFNGWLSAQYDKTRGVGDVAAAGPIGTSGPGVVGGLTPATPYAFAKGFPIYAPVYDHNTDTRYRWEFSQGLPGDLTVTYLGGWDKNQNEHALDGTTYPGTTNPPAQFLTREIPVTQNEELRLASAPDRQISWQVGGFYFHEHNFPVDAALQEEGGPFAGYRLINASYDVVTSSKAAFGQISFKPTELLKLTAGVRYTRDEKSQTGANQLDLTVATGGFAHLPIPPGCSADPATFNCAHIVLQVPGLGQLTDSKVTYHAGIDFSPTDANLLYGKFDTGYKAGGFNTSNGVNPASVYDPETVKAVELGTKNRFLNDRVQANLALFYMKYDGYQASQFTSATGGNAAATFNAGDAKDYGAEGEFITLLDAHTRFDFTGTWLHAHFTSGTAVDASTTASPLLSGNFLPNAPNASLVAGLQRTWDDGRGGEWTARMGVKYQTRIFFDIFNHPDTSQRAYVMGDATVNYVPLKSAWKVEGYVRNLANAAVLVNAWRNTTVAQQNYEFAAPRTYGVKLFYRF